MPRAGMLSALKYRKEHVREMACVVVDSGFSFTHIAPCLKGKLIKRGIRRTTSNLDLEVIGPNSVDEVLQGYGEEDDDPGTVGGLLLPTVQELGSDDSCTPPPTNSLLPPTTSRPVSAHHLPASAPASFRFSTNTAPCRSLPSPQAISAAFRYFAAPYRTAQRSKRRREETNEDLILRQIDQQLSEKLTLRQHFLLSLDGPMDKIPEHLQAYCEMHLRDVVRRYAKGRVPTTLTPFLDLDDNDF